MSETQIAPTVREIICGIRPGVSFDDSTDLVMNGVLDSFDIVSLVAALDEHYAINIDGRLIVPENFTNVAAIAALVERAQAQRISRA